MNDDENKLTLDNDDEEINIEDCPKTKVINMIGGPGAGKSTIAAGVFFALKKHGIKCEIVFEYSKEKVWEESINTMNDEIYIFAKQNHRQWRLKDKVDYIVTDHCLLNSIIYDPERSRAFKSLILREFSKYENLNYFVNRVENYEVEGRIQTEAESKKIDNKVRKLFTDNNLEFKEVTPENAIDIILNDLGIEKPKDM